MTDLVLTTPALAEPGPNQEAFRLDSTKFLLSSGHCLSLFMPLPHPWALGLACSTTSPTDLVTQSDPDDTGYQGGVETFAKRKKRKGKERPESSPLCGIKLGLNEDVGFLDSEKACTPKGACSV